MNEKAQDLSPLAFILLMFLSAIFLNFNLAKSKARTVPEITISIVYLPS